MRKDPTRTLTLRTKFINDMKRRFKTIRKNILKKMIDEDAFGLKINFEFTTDANGITAFRYWLVNLENVEIFSGKQRTGETIESFNQWTDYYIDSAYKQGVRRGQQEIGKTGLVKQSPIDFAFASPIEGKTAELLFTRTFQDLKNVTEAMNTQISRVLTQGLIDGESPKVIAREMVKAVDNIGINRASMIARTEIIRAHHLGMLDSYEQANIKGVKVMAEFSTASTNVCPDCADLEGRIFSLQDIRSIIPLHPNCRCVAIPANVGEDKTEVRTDRKSIIGEQYKRADGSAPLRGYFKEKTSIRKPRRRS